MKTKRAGVKFSYFVAKNRIMIKDEVNALIETKEPSELFKTYDEKRAQLALSMADHATNGKVITENGQYVITEKRKEFEDSLNKLKEKFSEVINERSEQIEVFKELLDEITEFKGYSISLTNLPDDIEPTVLEIFLLCNLLIEDKI